MKILKDFVEKIKPYQDDIFIGALIILVGSFGFGLGRLSKIEELRTPITIENVSDYGTQASSSEDVSKKLNSGSISPKGTSSYFVASKNGTKYYFPWCAGVKKINEANIIQFESRKEAELAGYEKASNCKGL